MALPLLLPSSSSAILAAEVDDVRAILVVVPALVDRPNALVRPAKRSERQVLSEGQLGRERGRQNNCYKEECRT